MVLVHQGSGLGTGRWDAQALGCPSVLVHQGAFKMYYVGESPIFVRTRIDRHPKLTTPLSVSVCLPACPATCLVCPWRFHGEQVGGSGVGVDRSGGERGPRLHQMETCRRGGIS